jgi:hypothetical protein
MGAGSVIISNFGDRDKKLNIIHKIWHRFGRGGFISSQLSTILTSDELVIANMNRWKHRCLVEHDGWETIKGKPRRKWKLTSQTIEKCVITGDDPEND